MDLAAITGNAANQNGISNPIQATAANHGWSIQQQNVQQNASNDGPPLLTAVLDQHHLFCLLYTKEMQLHFIDGTFQQQPPIKRYLNDDL